jgi:topoisomerase-4 subunit B
MRGLVDGGHLYLAVPPLYRLSQGAKIFYARDDAHKAALMASEFNGKGKVEISRFKGLGEMMPRQLKETTMDPRVRTLLRVEIAGDDKSTGKLVDQLMGNKPEARFQFIQERAEFAKADQLDI